GVARLDVILVARARLEPRHEALPHAGAVGAALERRLSRTPAVEVANDRNALGVRCPDAEAHAAFDEMRTEHAIKLGVAAFAQTRDVFVSNQSADRPCESRHGMT